MKHHASAAVCATVFALLTCVRGVHAQVNIAVNDLRDLPDIDLTNADCDCDALLPGNQCSLRAALQNANLFGGWVIVSLGAQSYGLSFGGTDDAGVAGDLDVFASTLTRLTIQGAVVTVIDGAGLISGGTPDRIFHITNTVANSCEIELVDLSIRNGAGVLRGAGVRQDGGRLALSNVNISDCTANDQGGGIYTATSQVFSMSGGGIANCSAQFNGGGVLIDTPGLAQVTLNNVGISNCSVSQKGGGVRTQAGSNTIMSQCLISGNSSTSGGGVSVRGTLQMLDCTVSGNFATPGTGGGIANDIGGSLAMERCSITSNVGDIAGGLNNSSGATLLDCTIELNSAGTGAGIQNNSTVAPFRMHRCTISANTAFAGTGGGGYRGFGLLELVNCTISSNHAPNGSGGGMYIDGLVGSIEINDCTIADNSSLLPGAGILTDATLGVSSVAVIGTIVAQNFLSGGGGASNFSDLTGTMPLLSAGANLDSDGTCGFITASDQSNVPAGIMPLFNNGGFTKTHALMAGSLAIDRGSCFTVNGGAILEDQRSQPRVARCDCGSFESGIPPPPSNDSCLAALPVLPGTLTFNNFGASTDGPPEPCGFTGLPNLDSDVWFEYIAPCDGTTVLTITPVPPSSPDRLLAVYNACPPPGGGTTLVCVSAIGGASATGVVTHVAGQSFIIRSGVPGGLQGDSMLDLTISCACPADIAPPGGDNVVGVADLLAVITSWGACAQPCPPVCAADIAPSPTGDCAVGVADLLLVITQWGPCP